MNDLNINLGCCAPKQIINFDIALDNIDDIKIYDNCNEYNLNSLEYAYSVDNVCWSCYMDYNKFIYIIQSLNVDFYLRIKVQGYVNKITKNNINFNNYTVQIDSDFKFSDINKLNNQNVYNPYSNLDCAIELQQQLSEMVASMFGIPIYYFKINPIETSKDLTFKEYTLMNVKSVKQIKMVVKDGQMPSAKPEFNDFGLDWESDWDVEITKGMFATAFGTDVQPTENDLIYVPMMKRMWQVNNAYEEKNDTLMWIGTSFKLSLSKYQSKQSIDLNDVEDLVNSFVKNKYEDIFGDEENYGSNSHNLETPLYAPNNLYNVYESDAIRKYVTCDSINIEDENIWYKGSLIANSKYVINNDNLDSKVIYQKQFCGDNLTCSFIITPQKSNVNNKLISIGDVSLYKKYENNNIIIYLNKDENIKISLPIISSSKYIIIFRYSKNMNLIELSAYKYIYNDKVPEYKLNKYHYWFDMNNVVDKSIAKYNIELQQETKSDIILYGLLGSITNIKILDIYYDNISEIVQMEPTNSHILINDTARKIVGNYGVPLN